MRSISRILWTSCLTAIVVLLPLRAQDDVDAAIQAAQTAKSPGSLEDAASKLEAQYQYGSALKLLDAALTLRGQINGDQSADYGLCLLKLGSLERKAGRSKQAVAHYAAAVRILPGRTETARVFLYLGISELTRKDTARATEDLQRAQNLDISLAGPVQMWTAYLQEWHRQPELAEAAYKSALAVESPDTIEMFETQTLYRRFLVDHGRDAEAQAITPHTVSLGGGRQTPHTPLNAPKVPPRPSLDPTGGVYRVGGGVNPPAVLFKVEPAYSEEARVAKISATVLLQLVVGEDGTAHNIKVVKAAGFGLDDCAVATVAQWRFKPGEKNGTPVPVYATVEVNFRLL